MSELSSETPKKSIPVWMHGLFGVFIVLCVYWVFAGFDRATDSTSITPALEEHIMMGHSFGGVVVSEDDAVRTFLKAALQLAEVYRFTNNNSYSGLCEQSDRHYTLEGESGGILKYIKFVGATEVFCATSDTTYMIEAKMPGSGLYYCVDHSGAQYEQRDSMREVRSCI